MITITGESVSTSVKPGILEKNSVRILMRTEVKITCRKRALFEEGFFAGANKGF
jgi:hypothetical protein